MAPLPGFALRPSFTEIYELLNFPICGGRSWEAHGGNRQPVHQPYRYRPTRAIAPNDIRLAIPVHIPRL